MVFIRETKTKRRGAKRKSGVHNRYESQKAEGREKNGVHKPKRKTAFLLTVNIYQ